MTAALLMDLGIAPALRILPGYMDTIAARALLLTIAWQESRCSHRRQIRGPAKSYFQFERAGVLGVLTHVASAKHAATICETLDVPTSAAAIHKAMEWQDVLASAFARLLLWTLPKPLPLDGDIDESWRQYLETWRPGKPKPETWGRFYTEAWTLVKGTR
jgi:hypothetical protein